MHIKGTAAFKTEMLIQLLYGLSTLFSVVSIHFEDCWTEDIDLVFALDCKYPVQGIEVKIRNILLNSFIPPDSDYTPRSFRVSVTDLRSPDNVTFSDIDNIEQYDSAFFNVCSSYKDVLNDDQLYKNKLQIGNYSSLLVIYIVQCIQFENWIYYPRHNRSFVVVIKNKACYSLHLEINHYVDADDELKENHELSVMLCDRCSTRWFPLRNEDDEITSCFHIRQNVKNVSWKDASNYCTKKKSHLATLEDTWESHHLKSKLKEIFNYNTNTSLSHTGFQKAVFIGMYQKNTWNTGHLTWVNDRPVVTLIYKEINLPGCNNTSNQFCFLWRIGDTDHPGIRPIDFESCTRQLSADTLCEYEIKRYSGVKNLYRLKLPDFVLTDEILQNKSNAFVIPTLSASYMSTSNGEYINNALDKKLFPTFACDKGGPHISYIYVCDGVRDCPAGEDEQICAFDETECNKVNKFICSTPSVKGTACVSMDARCNMIEDCPDGSDELDCDECSGTPCDGASCISNLWYVNCSFQSPNYNNITVITTYMTVFENYMDDISLIDFITICDHSDIELQNLTDENIKLVLMNNTSKWAPRCLYLRGKFGQILGCPDRSHLFDCEHFQCPYGFVKCFQSYCIPTNLVNDNTKDCPYGQDENLDFKQFFLLSYFSCYDSNILIHLVQVCDGERLCPRGDDELNCDVHCPVDLICLDGTVTVNSTMTVVDLSVLPPNTTYLNISGVDVSIVKANDKLSFSKLLVFIASHCNITDVVHFRFQLTSVYLVDLSFNQLTKLVANDFLSDFTKLYVVNISHNRQLTTIDVNYFRQFKYLTSLDLSFTRITQVNVYFNPKLNIINLQQTHLTRLNLSYNSSFEQIDLRGPNISEHQCQSEKLSLSTCDDLIGDNLKRILLWFVAISAVFGNAAVLVYRIFIDKATYKLTYGSFVICLGFSDLLMGVYLVIIGGVDLYYRDVYIGHQMSWRQSTLCQFSGVLATISGETSTFFIFLITFERYLTIRFPFGQYSFSQLTRNLSILLSWLLGFLLAFIPLIFQDLSLYSASGVCLGFPLRTSTGPSWIYSVVIFLFLNSLLFVIIACGQVAIYYHIHENSAKFRNSSQHSARRAGDITVAKQLALVLMSNFICWFPVCVLGLRTVVSDFEVDRLTYAWIVTVVLPVNAALNPFLYTIPRIYKMWEDYKNGSQRSSPSCSKTMITQSS
ncbi:hypothetical protein Btru_019584 [Bulinus truncatus]|nr:hypothetical protein Btru_019584 [Bulinus truncatus]